MPLTEPSRSTKVIVFVAALVCTTFPNGGDDFVLDVIERGRFHIGATLLNWVWISLVSIGLLWLLRQMSGYAKRWSWLPPLALLGCLGATPVFGIVFCELLDEKVRPVSVLIFLLIWAGMAVRTLAVVFQSPVPAKPAQDPTGGTPLGVGSQPTPSIPDAPPQDSPKPDPAPQSPNQHRRASQNGAANPLIAPGVWITVILCLLLQAAAWSGNRTPLAEWLGQSLFLAYLFLCIPALFPRQKRSTSFIASASLALFYLAGLSVAPVITENYALSAPTATSPHLPSQPSAQNGSSETERGNHKYLTKEKLAERAKIEAMFGDQTSFLNALTEPERERAVSYIYSTDDPQESENRRMWMANVHAMAVAFKLPAKDVANQYDALQLQYTAQVFGEPMKLTPAEFHGRIKERIEKRKSMAASLENPSAPWSVGDIVIDMAGHAINLALLAAMCLGYSLFRRNNPRANPTGAHSDSEPTSRIGGEPASADGSLLNRENSPEQHAPDSVAVGATPARRRNTPAWLLVLALFGAALAMVNGYFSSRMKAARAAQEKTELHAMFRERAMSAFDEELERKEEALRANARTAFAAQTNSPVAQPEPTPESISASAASGAAQSATSIKDSVRPLPEKQTAEGKEAMALRLTNELIEEATATRDAYLHEFREIDLDTCVLPSRMKNDPGFVEATGKIRRARAVIAKFKPISMGLMSRFRTKIENLPISSEEKRRCLLAFDLNAREAAKDGVELWALEEGIVDKIEEAVRFLAARDTWVLHDKKISFTKQEDREGFWELIGAIGRIGERQQAIIERNRAAIPASLGETP